MTTANHLPPPTVPHRGSVQKVFVDARVLAGFTDPNHFEQLIAAEHLQQLDMAERAALLSKAQAARDHVAKLPVVDLQNAVVRTIANEHVDAIRADPTFQRAFVGRSYEFAYVRPEKLVALQVHVEPRADPIPTGEPDLLHFALPRKWDVPAEVSFTPPSGPIYVVTSSPMLAGIHIEMDAKTGRVVLSPPPHVNLVQVAEFQGRFYLRNGYHRVYDAIVAGVKEMPALLLKVIDPADLDLKGTAFGVGYVAGRPRPPLVADFATPAAIDTKMRERRYGVTINFDVKPFNIGI